MRLLVLVLVLGCGPKDPPPTIVPATPLPADPDVDLDTMDDECNGMVTALETYKACPNNEDEDREGIDGWIEVAKLNFAASHKANPEPNAQKAIAAACHKATMSIKAATERCLAGKRPKID